MSSASCHVNECRLSVVKSLPLYSFPSGSNPITLYVKKKKKNRIKKINKPTVKTVLTYINGLRAC